MQNDNTTRTTAKTKLCMKIDIFTTTRTARDDDQAICRTTKKILYDLFVVLLRRVCLWTAGWETGYRLFFLAQSATIPEDGTCDKRRKLLRFVSRFVFVHPLIVKLISYFSFLSLRQSLRMEYVVNEAHLFVWFIEFFSVHLLVHLKVVYLSSSLPTA